MNKKIFRIFRTYNRALLFLGIFLVFFLWSVLHLDTDFGWHLRSGQHFLEFGIPKTDIYTYTADYFPWVNHEWLSDILLALLGSFGSYTFIAAVYAGMWTLAVWIVGRRIHPALIIVAVLGILPFAGIRAITWSMLGLALLILLLRQKDKRWRLAIPLLFLAWANLHGSFLIGIAYGGWQVLREKSWRLAVIGIVALGVTIINPYGAELYREIFMTMLDPNLHERISEWARFAFPVGSVVYTLVWLGITLQHGRDWRKYIRFDVLLFLMSVSSVRMVPLFILVSLAPLSRDIQAIAKKIKESGATEKMQKRVVSISSSSIVIAALVLTSWPFFVGHDNETADGYPVQSVAYLTEHPCNGQLFNHYNYGGYLIWALPSHKVYIDGRMPSWRHDGRMWMEEYLRVKKEPSYRSEQFARYNITCALVDKSWPMVKELEQDGWRIAVEEGSTVLLVAQ